MNVWVWGLSVAKVLGVFNCYYNVPCNAFFILSSLYLCVFGDDHVTRYMGANVDASEHVDS